MKNNIIDKYLKKNEEKIWSLLCLWLRSTNSCKKKWIVRYFLKKAEIGNGFAQFVIASCYDKAIFFKENPEQAFKYAFRSAQNNDSLGLNILGVFYEYGYGTPVNLYEAKVHYLKSIAMNNSYGMASLAAYYINHKQTNTDIAIQKLLLDAVKKKNSYAYNLLGQCYLNGFAGFDKNIKLAINLFKKSAKKKNSFGLISLGEIYAQGIGVKKNTQKARLYFNKAIQYNNPLALDSIQKFKL